VKKQKIPSTLNLTFYKLQRYLLLYHYLPSHSTHTA